MDGERLYAVIGRSVGAAGEPTLYHLTTRARAERLRAQRERATGRAYHVVPLEEWRAAPLAALQRAERAARGGR